MLAREDYLTRQADARRKEMEVEASVLQGWFRKEGTGAGDMERANVMARSIMLAGDKHDMNGSLSMVEVESHLLGSHYDDFASWLLDRRAANFRRFDVGKVGALKLAQLEKTVFSYLKTEGPRLEERERAEKAFKMEEEERSARETSEMEEPLWREMLFP